MPDESKARIGSLHLRVPGVGPDAGARIGRRAAELVAADLPAGPPRRIGSLHVRVTATDGAREPELSRRVARAIRAALR